MNDRISLSWLRDNWRPMSALLLASLPLLRAVGLAQGLTDEAFESLLTVTGLFLALYAGGRTVEKVADSMAQARVGVAQATQTATDVAQGMATAAAEAVVGRVLAAQPQGTS